jgi:multidrug transporter EmrE-like cation transporter
VSAWLALLAAGLLEVAWALGLKYSDGLTRFADRTDADGDRAEFD